MPTSTTASAAAATGPGSTASPCSASSSATRTSSGATRCGRSRFFVWTIANTLSIVFIADGVEATGGRLDVERQTASLLIGAVLWSYLGIIFEILTETVAWERWEGTIEYTFMAPLSRAAHLLGMGAFSVLYGLARTALLFAVVALFFGLAFPQADFAA